MAKAKPSIDSAKTPRKPRTKKESVQNTTTKASPTDITEDSAECPDCNMHQSLCRCANRQLGTEEPYTGSMDAMGRLGTGEEADLTATNDQKQVFSASTKRQTRDTQQETLGRDNNPQQPEPTSTDNSESTPQTDANTDAQEMGDVPLSVAETATLYGSKSLESVPLARVRPGETRGQCWERLRREGRAAGMHRRGAIAYAGATIDSLFPPPEPVIAEELLVEPEPEPAEKSPIGDELEAAAEQTIEPAPPAPPVDNGVSGLGDLPESWGNLPANAQLQVEIAWVSANRLRVRSGHGVDLSRALSPAPSYSALSWLETSILFPSKFADISVKATAQQDDEREGIRREKLAIEEIRSLLAEMLEG